MSTYLNDRLEFGNLGYRIESATYEKVAAAFARLGVYDTDLKLLLRTGHGVLVAPGGNPDIFFVVTEETMKQIVQDVQFTKFKKKQDREQAILASKIGTSVAVALTESYAKTVFLAKIAQHNAEG
jgi:hypothetical protein